MKWAGRLKKNSSYSSRNSSAHCTWTVPIIVDLEAGLRAHCNGQITTKQSLRTTNYHYPSTDTDTALHQTPTNSVRVHTSTTHTEFKEYVVCLWLFYRRYHSAFAHSSVIALLRAQYSIQLMGKAVVVMKTRSINMSNSCVGEFLHHP